MNDNNSRIGALLDFLTENPADDFSQYALALEYAKSGNRILALHHLEQLLGRNENYLAAYYQCGKLYEAEKDFQKARSSYEKGMAVAMKQKNSKTLNELRSALEMME